MTEMDIRSTFTKEVADEICRRLSEGETLTSICSDDGMPTRRTVNTWTRRNEEFAAAYDEAVIAGCHALLDQTPKIAKRPRKEIVKALRLDDDKARAAAISALPSQVQAAKLEIWEIHETVARKRPDLFGSKVALQHSGAVANVQMTHEEWLASLK